jgi:hypothetical protein
MGYIIDLLKHSEVPGRSLRSTDPFAALSFCDLGELGGYLWPEDLVREKSTETMAFGCGEAMRTVNVFPALDEGTFHRLSMVARKFAAHVPHLPKLAWLDNLVASENHYKA